MLLLKNNLVTYTLDPYLDIDKFLSLKDDFYYLYSQNYDLTRETWTSGGIDPGENYFLDRPSLYYTWHKVKDADPMSHVFKDKNALAHYYKLKYGCLSPYRVLNLNTWGEPIRDFVTPVIKDWIGGLPFETLNYGSMFFADHYCPLLYHTDFNLFPIENGQEDMPDQAPDIIWFRFDLDREFYLYEIDQKGKILESYPAQGYAATFNHFNWHGNMDSYHSASLTMKFEGVFTDEFKKQIYG